ncbi:type II secretion system protein GspM [Parahaliea aestuarii]|uniref:General secretion pathway protein GspM n=1 Tax=Parahaliea aestuarii TaxID=1852021 RepID=A0A5C8ZQR2_9GAMM|nr:type II secretion system protein GspM [Parahaliea aestuarii]TXS90069.1 general secretion pathway protein GspM [Parahaliea aestuarii]
MNWFRDNPRDAIFVLLTLALPLVLLLMLIFSLLGMRGDYQGEIERLEPRVARLMGLKNQESVLTEAAAQVDSGVLGLVYPVTDDRASVAASLQKNVRDIFADAGMTISSSQMLPSREDDELEHIPVKVTVVGGVDALDIALAELSNYHPLLMVESMEVYPSRGRAARGAPDTQEITATLQILALRQNG